LDENLIGEKYSRHSPFNEQRANDYGSQNEEANRSHFANNQFLDVQSPGSRASKQDLLEPPFAEQHFVEEVGLLFEMVGLPRMAGRVLGWLLISSPGHQSPTELAEVLQASKGSISTMTRLLVQFGLIERISLPGQQRDYFRIRPNAWSELTKRRMAQIAAFRQLAQRGLELLKNRDPQSLQRLEEMRDMHAFLEEELPLMLERWEQQRTHLTV
jgi:DNA-binding transcriptional regulator GbsR (MarR family)